MSTVSKGLLSCLAFLIFGWLAIHVSGFNVELEQRVIKGAAASLSARGHDWVELGASGQTLRISGTAPSETALREVLSLTRSSVGPGGLLIGGVTTIIDNTKEVAPVVAEKTLPDAKLWRVQYDGTSIVVDGAAPEGLARTILIELMQQNFASSTIADKAVDGRRDDEAQWLVMATTTLRALSLLERGEIVSDGKTFTVTGTAATDIDAQSAKALLEKPAPTFALAHDIDFVEAAPIEGIATKTVATDVVLANATPETLTQSLTATPPTSKQEFDDQPIDFMPATTTQLTEFNTVPSLSPERLAARCNTILAKTLTGFHIRFRSNSTHIQRGTARLLADVANAIERCGRVAILVEGHTDTTGRESRNLRLSQRRADAVKLFLEESGVGEASIKAKGFGSARPVAANATRAGRMHNRRIELHAFPTTYQLYADVIE